MAHRINEDRIFYYGEKPWHNIGTELKKPATAKEAIEAARLDYEVVRWELNAVPDGNWSAKELLTIPDRFATVRKDTKQVLGIVSDKYQPIQNVEAFDFFDSIVGEGKAIYHTAGAFGVGERIWILARIVTATIIPTKPHKYD